MVQYGTISLVETTERQTHPVPRSPTMSDELQALVLKHGMASVLASLRVLLRDEADL